MDWTNFTPDVRGCVRLHWFLGWEVLAVSWRHLSRLQRSCCRSVPIDRWEDLWKIWKVILSNCCQVVKWGILASKVLCASVGCFKYVMIKTKYNKINNYLNFFWFILVVAVLNSWNLCKICLFRLSFLLIRLVHWNLNSSVLLDIFQSYSSIKLWHLIKHFDKYYCMILM